MVQGFQQISPHTQVCVIPRPHEEPLQISKPGFHQVTSHMHNPEL